MKMEVVFSERSWRESGKWFMAVLNPNKPIDGVIYCRDRNIERNLGVVSDVVGVLGVGQTTIALGPSLTARPCSPRTASSKRSKAAGKLEVGGR